MVTQKNTQEMNFQPETNSPWIEILILHVQQTCGNFVENTKAVSLTSMVNLNLI